MPLYNKHKESVAGPLEEEVSLSTGRGGKKGNKESLCCFIVTSHTRLGLGRVTMPRPARRNHVELSGGNFNPLKVCYVQQLQDEIIKM